MSDLYTEKTQPASPNRQQQARQEGRIPKSRAVVTATLLLGAVMGMLWFGETLAERVSELTRLELQRSPLRMLSVADASDLGRGMIIRLLWIAGPLLVACMMLSVSGNLLQGRIMWLPDKLVDWGRIHPARRWQSLWSWRNTFDTLWGLTGVVWVFSIGLGSLWLRRVEVLQIAGGDWGANGTVLTRAFLITIYHVAIGAICYAAMDFAIEWWRWDRSLRQSAEEQREERKLREGPAPQRRR